MRLHFASVPVFGDGSAADELNRFLASHRVASIERRLIEPMRLLAGGLLI